MRTVKSKTYTTESRKNKIHLNYLVKIGFAHGRNEQRIPLLSMLYYEIYIVYCMTKRIHFTKLHHHTKHTQYLLLFGPISHDPVTVSNTLWPDSPIYFHI